MILASSTGRCNTIQCIDSTMLARENHLCGCARLKLSQGSVPAGLTLTSDLGFCLQCQAGSSLVLRRPIEIAAQTGHMGFNTDFSGNRESGFSSSKLPKRTGLENYRFLMQCCASTNGRFYWIFVRRKGGEIASAVDGLLPVKMSSDNASNV
jgi:hypothetical protein